MPRDFAFSAESAPIYPRLSGDARAATLSREYGALSAHETLEVAIRRLFPGRIALVSSFGAESAALLHLVAEIDPSTPVLFGDTGQLFAETRAHRTRLAERLGLTDLRVMRPDAAAVARTDPDGTLHRRDPDACCALRKVDPLEAALEPFDAWITGRKRHQTAMRHAMRRFESDRAGRVKINPLLDWTPDQIEAHRRAHALPAHPLTASGYRSIGCAPCTTPVGPDEDPRAGRWRGRAKEECGLHFVDGRPVRAPRAAPMD